MNADGPARPVLVVVDSRPRADAPLRQILERTAPGYEVRVVAAEHAREAAAANRPLAVLVHAAAALKQGALPVGLVVALDCRTFHPQCPVLVYTNTPSSGLEAMLARIGLQDPIVHERRLVESFDSLLRDLLEHRALTDMLGPALRPESGRLPARFRIDQFLDEARRALLRAAVHEHPDRTFAAAMVVMPLETFEAQLGQYDLTVPRTPAPRSTRGESILWCSTAPPPPK